MIRVIVTETTQPSGEKNHTVEYFRYADDKTGKLLEEKKGEIEVSDDFDMLNVFLSALGDHPHTSLDYTDTDGSKGR